jgi:hypothetical protein
MSNGLFTVTLDFGSPLFDGNNRRLCVHWRWLHQHRGATRKPQHDAGGFANQIRDALLRVLAQNGFPA